jgi:spore germination cell wall hydrolase CwlJ-like protein
MSSNLRPASAIAAAVTFLPLLLGAQGSGAVAQDTKSDTTKLELVQTISRPVVQPLPAEAQVQTPLAQEAQDQAQDAGDDSTPTATTLAALVAAEPRSDELSPELRCLAGAVYFEAKSESLPGQLAVADVVINRAKSGRFPASYCGVVFQRSQFSFVRGHAMPTINTSSQDWREAVAIARIADRGAWRSPAKGALFFHATRVSPGWRLTRIARVDNHVFYR